MDVCRREHALTQLFVAVDPELPEVGIAEHLQIPGIGEERGTAAQPVVPWPVTTIPRSLRAIEVPQRCRRQLAEARLVPVRAQPERVSILGQRVHDVVVDRRRHIPVLGVAIHRIGRHRAVERRVGLAKMPAEPQALCRRHHLERIQRNLTRVDPGQDVVAWPLGASAAEGLTGEWPDPSLTSVETIALGTCSRLGSRERRCR